MMIVNDDDMTRFIFLLRWMQRDCKRSNNNNWKWGKVTVDATPLSSSWPRLRSMVNVTGWIKCWWHCVQPTSTTARKTSPTLSRLLSIESWENIDCREWRKILMMEPWRTFPWSPTVTIHLEKERIWAESLESLLSLEEDDLERLVDVSSIRYQCYRYHYH